MRNIESKNNNTAICKNKIFFRIYLCLVLIALLSLISCSGKKEVKRVSEESKIAREAIALTETVKNAYTKKDIETIEKNSTKDGFRAISSAMKGFDSVELTFNPVFSELKENAVYLNIAWQGIWKKGSKTIEERGMAVFIMKGSPLKVDSILSSNPFRHPE